MIELKKTKQPLETEIDDVRTNDSRRLGVVKTVMQDEKLNLVNDWSEEQARDFLLKGGTIKTKVTNYDKDGNVTSFCITEKQVAPNYRLHLTPKEKGENDTFEEFEKGLR